MSAALSRRRAHRGASSRSLLATAPFAKQYGKQPAKANAEPYAGPLIIWRVCSGRLGADARSRKRRDALVASPCAPLAAVASLVCGPIRSASFGRY